MDPNNVALSTHSVHHKATSLNGSRPLHLLPIVRCRVQGSTQVTNKRVRFPLMISWHQGLLFHIIQKPITGENNGKTLGLYVYTIENPGSADFNALSVLPECWLGNHVQGGILDNQQLKRRISWCERPDCIGAGCRCINWTTGALYAISVASVRFSCHGISMLEPIIPKLRHVQQYLVTALVGHAACHDPGRCRLEVFTDQTLESFHVFFRSPPSIFLLLAFVTFCEHQCHGDLNRLGITSLKLNRCQIYCSTTSKFLTWKNSNACLMQKWSRIASSKTHQ